MRTCRKMLHVVPAFKTVDTCAAEFPEPDGLPLHDLRRVRDGGGAQDAPPCHDPGRRPEPHWPGHRVRLLLRARVLCARGGRVRDHHGELQPGNRVHRLRHVRQAVLRAAHVRGRHGHRGRGEARRRGGDVGRPDAAQAGERARRGGRAHHGHQPRGHRPGRGPRPLRRHPGRAGHHVPGRRHGLHVRGGLRRGRPDRVPLARAPQLRAGRARHGVSSTTPRGWTTTWPRRARPCARRRLRDRAAISSTASSTAPSRSTSTPSATEPRRCPSAAVMEHIEDGGHPLRRLGLLSRRP